MNYRTARWPVVTFSLMGINILVWLVTFLFSINTDGESDIWIVEHLWLTPATAPFYAWLTSMFVHAGFFHLFGNMIFLFLFGCCVEDMIGRGRFLLFYLLGGFAAELAYIATTPFHFASPIPLGGASGAISACMGMFLWLRADVEIEFIYFVWFFGFKGGKFEVAAWVAISFWFLKDLLWLVLGMMFPHAFGGGIAFGAHVGGILTGLGLLALFRISAPKPKEEPDLPRYRDVHAAVSQATRTMMSAPSAPIAFPAPVPASAPPPSAETPTIFLNESGVQTGPHTLTNIQARLAKRELAADSLYWSDGMSEWSSVQDLAGSPLA